MESIELVARQHLNVDTMTPGTDVKRLIMEQIVKSDSILLHWEAIAVTIPTKYETYSIELLRAIANLWVAVRGHSFAKGWTMKFQSKSQSKKGTRKALKQKDSNCSL